jgi:hypothetical protein
VLAQLEQLAHKVLQEPQALLALQDQQDLRDLQEQLGHKELKEAQDLLVLQV